ncbi:replication restart helicase PriA [Moheibacter lacus]|uniref:Replication restart protein PriA n=1 Tax=Moheibacter lacus TaxID=2745851 RepID=A0A838ZUC9_9FLAO|nr:primosomal protein N' [Moheibacter lacus]MBA5630561.1 primosomal protein N' [Moheibacter lacus]
MAANYFAEIILPLALPGTFTYEISPEDQPYLKVGQRVSVPFGTNKLYTGIVHSFHQNKPELFKTKFIDSVLDTEPLITEIQIQFWEWIAKYYMCSLGDVYRNAFPTALKWESETFVKFIGTVAQIEENLSESEWMVVNALDKKGILAVSEIAKLVDKKSTIKIIKSLWEKGIIQLDEVLKEKYTPKVELFIKVNPELKSDEKFFNSSLEKLKNAAKQRETLLQLIVEESQSSKPIKISKFIKKFGGNHAMFRSMEEKGMVEIYDLEISRIDEIDNKTIDSEALNFEQNQALKTIGNYFEEKKTVLLHGVTSSGKTEVYIKLIEQNLEEDKTTLFLLPEISISSQMVQRIRKYFGDKVGIYHSKFNQNERVELWNKTLNDEYKIIIGARSALFLPFQNLGLIIVDEEQETAYKQTDSRPYFHARDMALVLANFYQANVILGSATPSLETYQNAQTGKYGHVQLTKRFTDVPLPKIELIDLRAAMRSKEITGDISNLLREAIIETIKEGKQVLIFQNRRGFAPVVECTSCGHSPFCPNCDVPLTLHKMSNLLKCHYCGHSQAKPSKCSNCQSLELDTKGIGTEQIEVQLESIFPKLKIARMDVDAMRRKFAYEKTLEAFEEREIDIIVGTQMIAKGLDFSNVGLVGVIRADSMLNFPDFRAHEKAFQLLTQVAGRAGRRNEQGKVLIQTYNPDHEILQNVTRYDFEKTAKDILYERKSFLYPPFLRLIQITFRHAKKEKVDKVSEAFVNLLKPNFDEKHLLGPEEPSISRIRNLYIKNVLIKIPENASPQSVKNLIEKGIASLYTVQAFRSVRIEIDVDPQ